MATQHVIVELDHSSRTFLANLVREVIRSNERPQHIAMGPSPFRPRYEAITIQTPNGPRVMWVDEIGEQLWIAPEVDPTDAKPTWRQAWVRLT
jgi:hypothetical protein